MGDLSKTPQMYPATVTVENGAQNQPYPTERPNSESQWFLVTMNIINSMTHLLLGSVVISAFIYANFAGSSTFKQHIYLCVFGVS